jgi:hypothetical protein
MKLTRTLTWSVSYYAKFKLHQEQAYRNDFYLEARSYLDLKRQARQLRAKFRKTPGFVYLHFGETRFTIMENYGHTLRDANAK